MKIAVACSAAALAVGVAIAGPAASALANSMTPQDIADRDTPTPDDFTDPDQAMLEESIVELEQGIFDLEKGIEDVETTEASGGDTVVTLDTDILFDFDSAELSDAAKKKIKDLVNDLPTDSEITVGGHTDSKGEDDYNKKLSEDRAKAVAEVLTSANSDLDVTSKGYGESEPVAANEKGGEDDPEGRAKNRRVEVRYEG
ncbi:MULTISPECIES: OmpA family protein [unclassified Brevibacterium]|uniref:OmpA family protein n=1 Tax=unclassified Brevibacterium TaxID=2614124 RepID=UPI001092C93A|nr:OmpA family protein [Brevibacterium sp. S22]TGD27473.1 OmpA family protein [Brevibacterium sp. S22]